MWHLWYFSVKDADIFLCHENMEVGDETGDPESTAGAMYTSDQGTAEAVMAGE